MHLYNQVSVVLPERYQTIHGCLATVAMTTKRQQFNPFRECVASSICANLNFLISHNCICNSLPLDFQPLVQH